jgi:tRNA 2-thiouridine synthesizing protein A
MSEPDIVDARGLLCPLPVIRLQSAARDRPEGTLIRVIATDPGVRQDVPAWCRVHGHTIVETMQTEREIHLSVRLGSPPHKRAPGSARAPK